MKENPLSLFDSSGDLEATKKLAELIQFIGTNRSDGLTAKDRARILKETIAIIKKWCGIQNLGVRSIAEECRIRFTYLGEIGLAIIYDGECGPKTRITPLYAPCDSNTNFLTCFGKITAKEPTELINPLLYANTEGKIVHFKIRQRMKDGNATYPDSIDIRMASDAEILAYMDKHRLILDHCLRQLLSSVEEMKIRAMERLTAAEKSLHSLRTITELSRENDLMTLIMLSWIHKCGPQSVAEKTAMFQQIARVAGATPEERLERLTAKIKLLELREISDISGLPPEVTTEIIQNPSSKR